MFLPFIAFRHKAALIKRRVKSCSRAHGEFVTVTIPSQTHKETPAAGQVLKRGRRSDGGKTTIVFQRHHALEDRNSIAESLKMTGGNTTHHVIIYDLPNRLVGRYLEIEEEFFGCGMCVHC